MALVLRRHLRLAPASWTGNCYKAGFTLRCCFDALLGLKSTKSHSVCVYMFCISKERRQLYPKQAFQVGLAPAAPCVHAMSGEPATAAGQRHSSLGDRGSGCQGSRGRGGETRRAEDPLQRGGGRSRTHPSLPRRRRVAPACRCRPRWARPRRGAGSRRRGGGDGGGGGGRAARWRAASPRGPGGGRVRWRGLAARSSARGGRACYGRGASGPASASSGPPRRGGRRPPGSPCAVLAPTPSASGRGRRGPAPPRTAAARASAPARSAPLSPPR